MKACFPAPRMRMPGSLSSRTARFSDAAFWKISPLARRCSQVYRIVSLTTEPLGDPHIHAHVNRKAHRRSGRVDFFLAQPRRILDSLLNVLRLKIRVLELQSHSFFGSPCSSLWTSCSLWRCSSRALIDCASSAIECETDFTRDSAMRRARSRRISLRGFSGTSA